MEKSKYTLKDVARVAGVSIGTASKVVNNIYVNQKSKEAVERAIEELGYIPNALARSLKGSPTKTIGVMVPNVSNPVNAEVLRGIEDACNEHGYSVLFSDFHYEEEPVLKFIRLFTEKHVDGIVFASYPVTPKIEKAFKEYAGPVVLIMSSSKDGRFPNVTMDNEEAAYFMTKYLIGKGHKKILHLAGRYGDENAAIPRLEGYKRALKEAKIPYDEELVTFGLYNFDRGYEDVKRILSDGLDFTAIFAAADTIAIGAMHAISESGRSIPKDISVAGFDGINYSKFMIPSVCTIAQPFREFGKEGANMLVGMLRDGQEGKHIKLNWKFVENESVAQI